VVDSLSAVIGVSSALLGTRWHDCAQGEHKSDRWHSIMARRKIDQYIG
jgi:hypothetical protein